MEFLQVVRVGLWRSLVIQSAKAGNRQHIEAKFGGDGFFEQIPRCIYSAKYRASTEG